MVKFNHYIIDKNTNQICGFDIIDNKKIDTPSTISQLTQLLYNEDLLIFINRFSNKLEQIKQEEVKSKWKAEFKIISVCKIVVTLRIFQMNIFILSTYG